MNEYIRMSPRFSYVLSNKLSGVEGQGSTGWWGQRVAKLYGSAPESVCPSDLNAAGTEFLYNSIPIQAFIAADELRLAYYQRLYSVEDCMYAISQTGACSFEFDIFDSISTAPDGRVSLPRIGEKLLGSHCVAVHGYSAEEGEERYFLFANSWGEKWGDRGHGYLPFDYFEQGLVSAVWDGKIHPNTSPVQAESYQLKTNKGVRFRVERNWYPPLRLPQGYRLAVFDIYLGESSLPIGFIHAMPVNNAEIEIEEMYILPQYQNKGLGTASLKLVEKVFKSYGFRKLFGWVSAQDLVAGREAGVLSFYKKSGYTVTEDNSRFRDAVYRVEKDIL
jgi:GNAT superfamily N-acetyltransferase